MLKSAYYGTDADKKLSETTYHDWYKANQEFVGRLEGYVLNNGVRDAGDHIRVLAIMDLPGRAAKAIFKSKCPQGTMLDLILPKAQLGGQELKYKDRLYFERTEGYAEDSVVYELARTTLRITRNHRRLALVECDYIL